MGAAMRAAAVALFGSIFALAAAAQDSANGFAEAILSVQLNLESKGDHLVLIADDGDILVREEDMAALGLASVPHHAQTMKGVPYVSLRSLPDTSFTLDPEHLVLSVRIDPRRLTRRQTFDLAPQRDPQVLRPRPAGTFLNYNVTRTSEAGAEGTTFAGEFGTRLGDYLLASDAYSTEDLSTGERRNVRLSTSLTRDRRDTLERLQVGDFVTVQPTPLGSSLRLGGISFSRRFSIDPYYVRFPGQVVTGTAALPSEVFVYSNGVLVRRERVGPGGFELQNLVNLPGLQTTEVVVRDVLGNEQHIVDPYYYSESLLRPGLDEYSFDAGFERRNFGVESNDYGKPGFSAFYRRGLTSRFTLGGHAEALDRRYNLGPSASFGLGLAGISTLGFALGGSESGAGGAFTAAHSYSSPRWSASAAVRFEGRNFARAASDLLVNRRYDASLSASYALNAESSMSFGATASAPWDSVVSRSMALAYRVRASRDTYLTATATHSSGGALPANELLFTVSWYFDAAGMRNMASAQVNRNNDGSGALVQLAGGNPDAEGVVYRVNAQAANDAAGSYRTFNPALQWNAAHAVLRAETFQDTRTGNDRTELSVQGGVAAVGGEWALSRPVTDSFAIVKVGEVPGVRVYANNQLAGITGDSGEVFVPRLASYFENPVAIEDKDLPLNYIVPKARLVVSPALRSGVLLDFHARAVNAIAGQLVTPGADGGVRPFANARGSLEVQGERLDLLTASDGRFYVEQVPPGHYAGEAEGPAGAHCRFSIEVKPSKDVVSDLGEVRCAR